MKQYKKYIVLAITSFFSIILFALSCSNIGSGEVGIVKHFGAVEPVVLQAGAHLTRPWPFTSVAIVNTTTFATEIEAPAASKDLQAVHTKVTVTWSIAAELGPKLVQRFGYVEGDGIMTHVVMGPAVQEVVKAVSAQYTAEHLIVERIKVKLAIEEGLNKFVAKTLADRGCEGAINIANVAITNFEFSPEFNHSIEAKVKAEQDALRAENEKRTIITQAEAKNKQVTLEADSIAYKTEVESKTRAAAIERESKALEANPNLIQLRIAEKWNGVLPTYTGNSIPMLQLKQ